jgi:hypothetical protein
MSRRPELAEAPIAFMTAPATKGETVVPVRDAELEFYRRAKHLADLEIIELRAHLKEAEQLRQSLYYRVGRIAVEFFTTWRGFLFFWPRLFSLLQLELLARRTERRRAARPAKNQRPADYVFELDTLRSKIVDVGPAGAASWVRSRSLPPRLAARLLIEIARMVRRTDLALAIELGSEVIRLDRSELRVKWLALALAEAGSVTQAAKLSREIIESNVQLTGTERRAIEELFLVETLLSPSLALPPVEVGRPRLAKLSSVLLVASTGLPIEWSMRSVRLHATALAIKASGREVMVAVLPRHGATSEADGESPDLIELGGVSYFRLDVQKSGATSASSYLQALCLAVRQLAAQRNIDAIEAELLPLPAYAALVAARELGLPVILDYAGDELFPVPLNVSGAESERALLARTQQSRFAAAADHCVRFLPVMTEWSPAGAAALSETYGARLQRDASSLDTTTGWGPTLRNRSRLTGRQVWGFLGEALPQYDVELLGALPTAVLSCVPDLLPSPAMLIAGHGRPLERLLTRAAMDGFQDRLLFLRSPGYAEIPSILSAMDVFVAPLREDAQACLVTVPYEIVQALSLGIPVVAPDTRASRQWTASGLPIALAAGQSVVALAERLAQLLSDSDDWARESSRARAWADEHTTPELIANELESLYGVPG